jgi:hypothetical protein
MNTIGYMSLSYYEKFQRGEVAKAVSQQGGFNLFNEEDQLVHHLCNIQCTFEQEEVLRVRVMNKNNVSLGCLLEVQKKNEDHKR